MMDNSGLATVEGMVAPLDVANIDTDQIIPARYLLRPRNAGYGSLLFRNLRFTPDGAERPDFILNQPGFSDARILVASMNFGCGSAREQAVYALTDFGIRAVVAPSFGEIFQVNCARNGLLPATVSPDTGQLLQDLAIRNPGFVMTIDLKARALSWRDGAATFEIPPSLAERLLSGSDEIDDTLGREQEIAAYERSAIIPLPAFDNQD